MGDPTEQNKGSDEGQEFQSDYHPNDDVVQVSDNEDHEAEQIEPAVVDSGSEQYSTTYRQLSNMHRSAAQPRANMDTVHSILSSISNSNAAVVIPVEEHTNGEDEIDADRMERFYSGALSAITKMRRQTQKAQTKIDHLREEVGHATMQAWTDEHFDNLKPSAPK